MWALFAHLLPVVFRLHNPNFPGRRVYTGRPPEQPFQRRILPILLGTTSVHQTRNDSWICDLQSILFKVHPSVLLDLGERDLEHRVPARDVPSNR